MTAFIIGCVFGLIIFLAFVCTKGIGKSGIFRVDNDRLIPKKLRE